MFCDVYRMFDQQRVHFAKLQNQQAESYFKNLRDVTKATLEANVVQQSEKKDHEERLKREELH